MKEYAEDFYKGKQWQEVRRAYLKSKHYICERCGMPAKLVHHKQHITPETINDISVTLSWDNLEALCQDCHNAEHHGTQQPRRYSYDADGNIINAPCPHKNNYF